MKEVIGYGKTMEEAMAEAINKLNAPKDAKVLTEIVELPTKKVLGLFGGSSAKVKAYYDDVAYAAMKESLKKEQKAKEWKNRFIKAVGYLKSKDYQNAESSFYNIKSVYDKAEDEIRRLSDERSAAFWAKDENRQNDCTKKISEINRDINNIKEIIYDVEVGFSVSKFKRRTNKTPESIAEVLGTIREYDGKINNGYIDAVCKDILNEYGLDFIEKAKEHYSKANEFIDDSDMRKAKMYLMIPALVKYKDSEPLYAIVRLLADNDPSTYEDILKTLVETRDKIISESHRKVADDIVKMIAELKRNTNDQSHIENKAININIGKSRAINTDEDVDFMDWVLKNSKRKEEGTVLGDSGFPKDVETFPNADEIW